MHGVSFKKRAPRAIKEIREFAVKAMVSFVLFFVACFIYGGVDVLFANEMMGEGYERRPTRSATQQEGVGGWDQGCAVQVEGQDIEETE